MPHIGHPGPLDLHWKDELPEYLAQKASEQGCCLGGRAEYYRKTKILLLEGLHVVSLTPNSVKTRV